MFHKVKYAWPSKNYILYIVFEDNEIYLYDVKPLFEWKKAFLTLKDENLFRKVKVDVGGKGIIWNDDIDISSEELWTNGVNINDIKDDDISKEEIKAAEEALEEYEKNPKTYSIEEIMKKLGIEK